MAAGLFFARGYLKNMTTNGTDRLGESSAQDDLRAFMRRANDAKYKILIEVAQKLLGN